MASWAEFTADAPDLAAAGMRLAMIRDPTAPVECGLAYLATVKADGSPRIHPISPALHEDHLYAFILAESPKLRDLQRDGRFALHAWPAPFPEEGFDDSEWYLEGRAEAVDNELTQQAIAALVGEKPDAGTAFRLDMQRVLYKHRPDGTIVYERWHARE